MLVNLDAEIYDRLVKASGIQKHKLGQLAWILIEWALPFYEEARSVEALKEITVVEGVREGTGPPRKTKRRRNPHRAVAEEPTGS